MRLVYARTGILPRRDHHESMGLSETLNSKVTPIFGRGITRIPANRITDNAHPPVLVEGSSSPHPVEVLDLKIVGGGAVA